MPALALTDGDFFLQLDADHVLHEEDADDVGTLLLVLAIQPVAKLATDLDVRVDVDIRAALQRRAAARVEITSTSFIIATVLMLPLTGFFGRLFGPPVGMTITGHTARLRTPCVVLPTSRS